MLKIFETKMQKIFWCFKKYSVFHKSYFNVSWHVSILSPLRKDYLIWFNLLSETVFISNGSHFLVSTIICIED